MTSNSRVYFGGDPDHDVDAGIFKQNSYHYGIRKFYKFC